MTSAPPSANQLRFEATAERVGGAALNAGSKGVSMVGSAAGGALNRTTAMIKRTETSKILTCMAIFNMINGVGIVIGGVTMFLMVPDCYETTNCPAQSLGIIAFYTVIFGTILLAFEGRIGGQKYSDWLRKYFGFMFNYTGRMLFLLFISTMLFSSLYQGFALWWVSLLVGLVTTLNALFNCLVIWYHPGFQGGARPTLDRPHRQDVELGGTSQPSPFGSTMIGGPTFVQSGAQSYNNGDSPFVSNNNSGYNNNNQHHNNEEESSGGSMNPFSTVVT